MVNFIGKTIKATIIYVIVALFIVGIISFVIRLFAGAQISEVISLLNKVSINISEKEIEPTIMTEENKIKNYPEYGTEYATIEISRIGKKLPVYFGDSLDILKNGVGHYAGSYFPSEGGSIIYLGHNSSTCFRRLGELQLGDKIIVTTSYGKYTYSVYDMQIIKETEPEKLEIQKEKEILMIYTCYPFANIGHAYQRYVLYSELVEE